MYVNIHTSILPELALYINKMISLFHRRLLISFCVILLIVVDNIIIYGSDDENSARLILYKSTGTDPVVESQDFLVIYQIYNSGDATAKDIEINDRYDPNSFEALNNINDEGNVLFELEELAPGAQSSFNVTVRPKLFGVYESTRARVKYGTGAIEMEGVESDYRRGFSTSLGRVKIISAVEYEKSTSLHLKEWSFFVLYYTIPIGIPFLLWQVTRSASQSISLKKKI